jgi:hypothetical protein
MMTGKRTVNKRVEPKTRLLGKMGGIASVLRTLSRKQHGLLHHPSPTPRADVGFEIGVLTTPTALRSDFDDCAFPPSFQSVQPSGFIIIYPPLDGPSARHADLLHHRYFHAAPV